MFKLKVSNRNQLLNWQYLKFGEDDYIVRTVYNHTLI